MPVFQHDEACIDDAQFILFFFANFDVAVFIFDGKLARQHFDVLQAMRDENRSDVFQIAQLQGQFANRARRDGIKPGGGFVKQHNFRAANQRARAVVSDTTYGDIRTRNDPKARTLAREGLAAADMTESQQATLRQLLSVYSNRMSPATARAQWERIDAAGFGNVHFVWAGSAVVGKAHYYRIHGPTVLVEYDNSQNNANHSHTVWRDLQHDFGGDMLRAHYEAHRH